MNVVPTRATRHLGDRMIRDATDEFGCGADAVLECLEDCMLDQVPALIGYILDRCAPAVDVEIVVEQATPVPQTVSDYAALTAATLDEVAATFPVTAAEILQEQRQMALDGREVLQRAKPRPRSLLWRLVVPRERVARTDKEIKAWAVEVGLADGIHRGQVPMDLVHAYAAAHPESVSS